MLLRCTSKTFYNNIMTVNDEHIIRYYYMHNIIYWSSSIPGAGFVSICISYNIKTLSNLTGRKIVLVRGPLQKYFTFPDDVIYT